MTFRFRNKEFVWLSGGWFARQVERGAANVYRLYWGVTRPNNRRPLSMTVAEGRDGRYFDFPDLAAAAAHVRDLATPQVL